MKERNVSLDLYRMLCMFLITTIHMIGYSGLTSTTPVNTFLLKLICTLQRFSISGFTLITAYFLVTAESTARKTISFVLRLLFFSVAILTIYYLIVPNMRTFLLRKSFLPFLYGHYWYPLPYLILLLLAPSLNRIVHALSKKDLLSLILVLSFAICVFFPLSGRHSNVGTAVYIGHESHSLLWFILLYLIAACIRTHGVHRPVFWGPVLFFGCIAYIFILPLLLGNSAAQKLISPANNSLLSLLITVSSFIMAVNIKLNFGRVMNQVVTYCAPALFVVYLIQEHEAVREPLWNLVNISRWADSPYLIPIMILVFLLLFAGALFLDLLYRIAHKLIIGRVENLIFCLYRKICSTANKIKPI